MVEHNIIYVYVYIYILYVCNHPEVGRMWDDIRDYFTVLFEIIYYLLQDGWTPIVY